MNIITERQQFIDRWTDISRQDNMHNYLLPSDFRVALRHIDRADKEIERLREALEPFAKCADELDGSEDVTPTPDDEWAKFRLLASDYRKARAALKEG